jgi:hypothetical protein
MPWTFPTFRRFIGSGSMHRSSVHFELISM